MPKITIQDFFKKKAEKKKITMLTAYDYPFAQIVDEAGIDAILVGDSLGMVVQGLENTLPVTMDEMIYHTKMVSRAVKGQVDGVNSFKMTNGPVLSIVKNCSCYARYCRFKEYNPLPKPKIYHLTYTLSLGAGSITEEPCVGNLQARFCEGH
jgi:hypothetical protein